MTALQSPRIADEKTTTLVVHDHETMCTVIRYDRYVVIEKHGRCRVYDEDDVADVLRTELRDAVRVEKWKYMTDGTAQADVAAIRTHLVRFDAGSETRREARVTFKTKRGLILNELILTYDGEKIVAMHRSEVTIGRYDALESTTTFDHIESAIGFVGDHLSFRDDAATMELGRVTKTVEIKILKVDQ